jgi:hypothetical protein
MSKPHEVNAEHLNGRQIAPKKGNAKRGLDEYPCWHFGSPCSCNFHIMKTNSFPSIGE